MVCDGSCSVCPRCLRLYICDAVDCGGISAWRTWLGSRIALPNRSSSAMLHSSSNVGRSSGQYPWRRARSSTESMRLRSGALVRPRHALAAYVKRATTVARYMCCRASSSSPRVRSTRNADRQIDTHTNQRR